MTNFNEIKELIASLEADANKFWEQGNSSAGTRLRNGMQKLKELAQAERKAVTVRKETNKRIL